MQIFPAQYSTLSAKALNVHLMEAFGLQNTSCRLLIRNVSDTYVLESETEQYIFKIYRDAHRSLNEIKGELTLLNLLKENGVSISYPINDRNNQQIQRFQAAEGVRYGVLFSFAKGEVVYEMNDKQLAVLGVEMARLHSITANLELPFERKEYNIETTLLQPIKVIKPAFSKLSEEYDYLHKTTLEVADAINKLDLQSFSYGYCHYDFLPKNFHFNGDDHITFFDFDFAGKGYFINDITSFIIHYFLENITGKISMEEAAKSFGVFVKSYRSVKMLNDAELASIKYFGFAFWMFYFQFHFENYDDWSSIFFNDKFIKGRVGLIKQWMEWDFETMLSKV